MSEWTPIYEQAWSCENGHLVSALPLDLKLDCPHCKRILELEKNNESLHLLHVDLEADLAALREELSESEKVRVRLSTCFASLSDESNDLREQNQTLSAECGGFENDLAALREKNESLKSNRRALLEQIQELEADAAMHEGE